MDNDTKLINLALDAGEIMLKNGAETFRVQDTMKRILSTTGREKIEATAISTALIVTLPYSVKLATKRKSLTHYAKGTQSPDYTGSYCLYVCGFRFYFTPLPGFFSPFLHSTGSLSVDHEYLALEDGPPIFRQDVTCPALLIGSLVPHVRFRIRGYHPL